MNPKLNNFTHTHMNTSNIQLTDQQKQTIKRFEESLHILEIHYEIGKGNEPTGPIMVKCKSRFNGFELWYGIETNGYAHS
jgi:hypothetical protein